MARKFQLMEKTIINSARSINQGELPDILYIDNTPLYLQKNRQYAWDRLGEKPFREYPIMDITDETPFYNISLEPSDAFGSGK